VSLKDTSLSYWLLAYVNAKAKNVHKFELFLSVQDFIAKNVIRSTEGYLCKLCSKFMKYRKSIRRHAEQMHIDLGVIFQCPMCKADKNTKNALQLHVYTKHPELKGMDFEQCRVTEPY
jgi:hypothetical protein